MSELIPGTTLPVYGPATSVQDEGRNFVRVTEDRVPVSLFERLAARDDVSPAELAFLDAAIRAFDRRPKTLDDVFATTAGVTDATTGNLVLPLFVVPAGTEAHITHVIADVPGSTTITPTAPFTNAASFAFLAAAGASSGGPSGGADALRQGIIAFAPDPASATGPVLPWKWAYNDSNAPVLQGGDQLWYVIHGGSVAGIRSVSVQVTYRVNLYTNMQ